MQPTLAPVSCVRWGLRGWPGSRRCRARYGSRIRAAAPVGLAAPEGAGDCGSGRVADAWFRQAGGVKANELGPVSDSACRWPNRHGTSHRSGRSVHSGATPEAYPEPLRFGDLLAVRDELAGTIVTLGDRPWSQVRARRASFPALVPVWVSSGFPVPAELGEQSGERSGMPGVPEIATKARLTLPPRPTGSCPGGGQPEPVISRA